MNAKKREADTPAQATAEETAAHRRIILSTAGEDRWKCGLEYICCRLDDAGGYAEAAAARILPDVADVKLNPVPTLASLCATPPGWKPAVNLSKLCELIFDQLQKEAVLKPDVELLHHGNKRLETFADYWFVFLFGWNGNGGCLAFMRKKIALAQALGKQGAADKLDEAFRQLMPAFKLTDWDADAKRFAAEITPDGFHVAFRNGLKLDAEATAEINGAESQKPVNAAIGGEQAEVAADNPQTTPKEIKSKGFKNHQTKKRGRRLTTNELRENARKNELITEVRRRAKAKYKLGRDGITAAYDEIDEESRQAGSKWHSIMSLATREAIIDKAKHNKRYVTS